MIDLTPDTEPGIVADMPEAEYHAHPALSSTQVKWLLESPARYRYNLTHQQPHKKSFDLGSAVHSKALGRGWGIVELDFPDWRTKAAQQERDAAYAAGMIPMLKKDMVIVHDMAESVLADPDARLAVEGADPEVTVFATDPETGVDLRCRFDSLRPDLSLAIDLKTMAGRSTVAGFSKAVADLKYYVSHEHYLDTLELATGERPPKVYIAVEKDPPYFVAVFRLSQDEIDMGRTEARAARRTLALCREHDVWPHRSPGVQITQAPMRLIYDHTDRFMKEQA